VVGLVSQLEIEKPLGNAWRHAIRLANVDSIVLDKLGYLLFSQPGGALLFFLIGKLYVRTSIIVVINFNFWRMVQGFWW